MLNFLYSLAVVILSPFIIIYKWKVMGNFGLRQRIWERLGKVSLNPADVWIQASSVGEINTLIPFIERLGEKGVNIVVSTMTGSGFMALHTKTSGAVPHFFFALDLKLIWRMIISRIKPKVLIIMEREIWPNLISVCGQKKIKIIVLNARMPDKSLKRLSTGLMRSSYNKIDLALVQSKKDAENLVKAGINKDRLTITGNLKFNLQIPATLEKFDFGKRPVWVAGSTHEGEEEILLAIHKNLLKKIPAALLVIAPRHPKRFDDVWKLIDLSGMKAVRYSAQDNKTCEVYLLDTMGSLMSCYAYADVAFVGGSLVAGTGGHNLLEPAVYGKPVISGYYLDEFRQVEEILVKYRALRQITSVYDGEKLIGELFSNSGLRKEMGENARRAVAENNRALATSVKEVMKFL